MSTQKRRAIPAFILFLFVSLSAIVAFVILAPFFLGADFTRTNLTSRSLPPFFIEGANEAFPLGTDTVGRDFFTRLVYATQNSLLISSLAMLLSMALGVFFGAVSGLYSGWVDAVISFVTEIRMSIPFTVIALVCAAIFGTSKLSVILIMGLTGWSGFARLIRGQIIQLREAPFIEAARCMGSSKLRILKDHLLINIASSLIVMSTMTMTGFILLESSMSYLGVGIQPPEASLGSLISDGRDYLLDNWWLSIFPSIILVVIMLEMSLIGDWLRDKFDPKLQDHR